MKERISITLDSEKIKILKKLLASEKYRNQSHVMESALAELIKKEGYKK